jgi:glycosyltransferase involved in cell wall biosynthesis
VSQALESVFQQTLPELEIIVVDRASTDRTLQFVRAVAARSPRVRLETIHVDEEMDYAAAINSGIERASGDFIAVLDARDLYHPQRLALLHKALDDDSGAQLAFSAVQPLDAHCHTAAASGTRIREKYAEVTSYPRLEYALVDANLIASPGNLFFRRELFEMVGGFEYFEGFTEWDFALRTLHFATPVFVPRPLYFIPSDRASTVLDVAKALGPVRDAVLRRFFDSTQAGVLRLGVPSRRFEREYFHEFVTARGYERFVSSSSSAEPISRYWYPDGWAPPKLRLPLVRGGQALRLRGRLPEYYSMLHGQNLRIFVDGRSAGSYSVEPGDFEVCFPANTAAAIVDIEIHASRWLVPKDDLEDSDDARLLAYLIDKVEWQGQPCEATGVLERDSRR